MSAIVTQLPVEVVVQPNTQKARLTQLPVEVVVQLNPQKARLTQLAVEVVVKEINTIMGQMPFYRALKNNV